MGIGIDSSTILVNANAVPIPSKWSEEHHPETGYHGNKFGNITVRDSIPTPLGTGMLFIRTDLLEPSIEYYNGVGWVAASSGGAIPSGSKMLFIQDTVPTGWTLDVSANDRVIRVVDVEASGGVEGGSWTISGISGDGHELSISEMPSHTHSIRGGTRIFDPSGFSDTIGVSTVQSGATGGGAAHTHTVSSDGTWRPSYINAIICIRD
jgi:hypothetical protein